MGDEPGGSHLSDEEIEELEIRGYSRGNIGAASLARANGMSFKAFMMLLGPTSQAQVTEEPPVQIFVRTTDQVMMELAENAEIVLRPYTAVGGALMNMAGDAAGIYIGLSIALAPEAGAVAIGAGVFLAFASADDFGANSVTLYKGEPPASLLQYGVMTGARELGSSEQDARNLGQLSTVFLRSAQAWNAAMVFEPNPTLAALDVETTIGDRVPSSVGPSSVSRTSTSKIFRGSASLDEGSKLHYMWESPSGKKFDLYLDVEVTRDRLVIKGADIMPESGTFAEARGSLGVSEIKQLRKDLGGTFGVKELEIVEPLPRTTGAIGSFGKPGVYKVPD